MKELKSKKWLCRQTLMDHLKIMAYATQWLPFSYPRKVTVIF